MYYMQIYVKQSDKEKLKIKMWAKTYEVNVNRMQE